MYTRVCVCVCVCEKIKKITITYIQSEKKRYQEMNIIINVNSTNILIGFDHQVIMKTGF